MTFTLTDNDRNVDVMRKRLQAAKPTRLVEIKGKKDDTAKLVDELVGQAIELSKIAEAKRVAVFTNRVMTAKNVHEQLRKKMQDREVDVQLVIGRMRAIDRDDLYKHKWKKLKSDSPRRRDDVLTFVVSTQCLEVGADLDFDVLVSECASIDALLQRFGRLDRLGEFGRAQGAIVIGSWQVNPKQPDPIYQEALARTWEWLKKIGGESGDVNMGIESRAGDPPTVREQLNSMGDGDLDLRLVGENAPILLPAHVDMLAQTNPVPEPDPLIELFLHGPKRGAPDVQVVWRSDLEYARTEEEEIEIVKLCPPSSPEAMSVSISAFKKWLAGDKDINDTESDLEVGVEQGELTQRRKTYVLAWNEDKSERVWDPNKIKPGQTLILRTSVRGWDELGYIPEGALIDAGDRAALIARRSVSLRLHPQVMEQWPETPSLKPLMEYASKEDADRKELEKYLSEYGSELVEEQWPHPFIEKLDEMCRKEFDEYPDHRNAHVLRARMPLKKKWRASEPVFLEDHLTDVEKAATLMASGLDGNLQEALRKSARFHDYGKIDLRFQAWLRGGDLIGARYLPKPLAKSGNNVLQKQQAVGLPEAFRHELLSLTFAEKSEEINGEMRDLILHLIAAHHGRCRPFAPVVLDASAECVSYGGISVCKEERVERAPHLARQRDS